MNKKIYCWIGMIIGFLIDSSIFVFIKGNLNPKYNLLYFSIYVFGSLIILISLWLYPENPAKNGATKNQDKEEKVLISS